jgi:glyoxylase-like metal-dependent hydrolase (beta-lactamase superfamily II)
MKRILVIAAVVVLLPIVALGVLMAVTFSGARPAQDGQVLVSGAVLVKDGYVNAFILPLGGNDLALIDCGNDVEAGPLKAALAKMGLDASAVKAIFLTHGHADHTGGCHNFPKAAVYALTADQPLAEGTGKSRGPLTQLLSTPKEKLTKVGHPLSDGESVAVGLSTVRAFAVPGHTAGSAAYLANGVLYLGDSAGIATDGALAGAPWAFSDDVAQNHASLAQLAKRLAAEKLEVKQLASGHTGVGEGLGPLERFVP